MVNPPDVCYTHIYYGAIELSHVLFGCMGNDVPMTFSQWCTVSNHLSREDSPEMHKGTVGEMVYDVKEDCISRVWHSHIETRADLFFYKMVECKPISFFPNSTLTRC